MALILKNKYYLYAFNELIGGTMCNGGGGYNLPGHPIDE